MINTLDPCDRPQTNKASVDLNDETLAAKAIPSQFTQDEKEAFSVCPEDDIGVQ